MISYLLKKGYMLADYFQAIFLRCPVRHNKIWIADEVVVLACKVVFVNNVKRDAMLKIAPLYFIVSKKKTIYPIHNR